MKQPYTRAERLARDLFADRAILTCSGELWTDKPVEPATAHDIRSCWPALVGMMEAGSLWLCPTHELHKNEWKFVDGRWLCLACKRLHPQVSKACC